MFLISILLLPFKIVMYFCSLTRLLYLAVFLFPLYVIYRIYTRGKVFLSYQGGIFYSSDNLGRAFLTMVIRMKDDVDFEDFKEYCKRRLHLLPFNARVRVGYFTWPYYEKVQTKWDEHIHEDTLEVGDDEDVMNYCTKFAAKSMDMNRPLWDFTLLHGYDKDKCIIVWRFHHACTDGLSAIQFMFHMTNRKDPFVEGEGRSGLKKKKKKIVKPGLFKTILYWISVFCKVMTQPMDTPNSVFSKRGGLQSHDSVCPVTYCDDVKVDEIKELSRKYGAGFNSILISCVSGGINKYLREKGNEYDKEMILKKKDFLKSLSWANTRKETYKSIMKRMVESEPVCLNDEDLTVNFGVFFMKPPLHIDDHEERIQVVDDQFRSIMFTPEPLFNGWLMTFMGFLPPFFSGAVYRAIGYKTSLSFSNVPGPQHARTFCGVEVDQLYIFSTPQGTLSNLIILFSYNGKVSISNQSSFNNEDAHDLIKYIRDSFVEHIDLVKEEEEGDQYEDLE